MEKAIGKWAFFIGVLVAIAAGIVPQLQEKPAVSWLLLALGLIVGLLNIVEKEATTFLIAAIALISIGSGALAAVPAFGLYIKAILSNIVAIVGPAALVVALKAVYSLGKP